MIGRTASTIAQEIERFKGAKRHLLDLLSDHQWHGQQEMRYWGGDRYSARLDELRKEGFDIEPRCVGPRRYEWRLRAHIAAESVRGQLPLFKEGA